MKNTTTVLVLLGIVLVIALIYTSYNTVEGFADTFSGTLSQADYNIYNKYKTVFKPAAVAAIFATLPSTRNAATRALRTATTKQVKADKVSIEKTSKSTVMKIPRETIVFKNTLESVLFNGVLKKCGYTMRLPVFDILTGPTSFSQKSTPQPAGKLMTPEEYLRLDNYIGFYIKPALEYVKTKTTDSTAKKVLDTYISYCSKAIPTRNLLSMEPYKANVLNGIYPSDLMTNIFQEDVIALSEAVRLQILTPLFKKYSISLSLKQLSFNTNVSSLVWSPPTETSSSSALDKAYKKAVEDRKKPLGGSLTSDLQFTGLGTDLKTIEKNLTKQAEKVVAKVKANTKTVKSKKTANRKNKSYKHLPTCASLERREEKEEECTCVYDY